MLDNQLTPVKIILGKIDPVNLIVCFTTRYKRPKTLKNSRTGQIL